MNQATNYYKLTSDEVYDVFAKENQKIVRSKVEGIDFLVFPHVCPSHKFRTTSFLLKSLKNLVRNKKVCDMGCGAGIVGLFALQNGAKQVIQIDINPNAVENAKANNVLHGFEGAKIETYLSDCFDSVPETKFDLIVFNMPFHCENIKIDDPLKYAFYDPEFTSIRKFLAQSKRYSHKDTKILIAFSSKGETKVLEAIFEQNHYNWKLWKKINSDQMYDNRLYLLKEI